MSLQNFDIEVPVIALRFLYVAFASFPQTFPIVGSPPPRHSIDLAIVVDESVTAEQLFEACWAASSSATSDSLTYRDPLRVGEGKSMAFLAHVIVQ